MKRSICIVIVLVLALAVALIGCGEQAGEEEFTRLYKDFYFTVYRHNATGVCYLIYSGHGVIPMFNADGTLYTGG